MDIISGIITGLYINRVIRKNEKKKAIDAGVNCMLTLLNDPQYHDTMIKIISDIENKNNK